MRQLFFIARNFSRFLRFVVVDWLVASIDGSFCAGIAKLPATQELSNDLGQQRNWLVNGAMFQRLKSRIQVFITDPVQNTHTIRSN